MATKAFTALIVPFAAGVRPDQGLPKPQPPIGAPPRPDQGLPGRLPHPSHPIYYPLPPGVPPPHPDQGLPGSQPHPDQGLPGSQPHPDNTLPEGSGDWEPVYIWGGGNVPMPTPPIALPPDGSWTTPGGDKVDVVVKPIWTEEDGWQAAAIIVPGEGSDKPVVTPSGQARRK